METANSYPLYTDPWAWVVAAIFAAYAVTLVRGLWLWRREDRNKKDDAGKTD